MGGKPSLHNELKKRWDTRSGLPSSQTGLLDALTKAQESGNARAAGFMLPLAYMQGLLDFEMAEEWRLRGDTDQAKAHVDKAIFSFLSAAETFGDGYDLNLVAGAQR